MKKEQLNSSTDPNTTDCNGSLSERLQTLLKGRSTRKAAEDWGIGTSTLNAYLKGSVPNLNIAQRIASIEGVDLVWLATGAGTIVDNDIMEGRPDLEASPLSGIDKEVLAKSIEAIDLLCKKKHLNPDSDKKAKIILLVYQMSMNSETADESIYYEMLKLVS